MVEIDARVTGGQHGAERAERLAENQADAGAGRCAQCGCEKAGRVQAEQHGPGNAGAAKHLIVETRLTARASPWRIVTTIVTLRLDDASQSRLDVLRSRHYPAALNQIAAHLTLFHTLPADLWVGETLQREAAAATSFALRVSGVRSLGRGVAYFVESTELTSLHGRLAAAFGEQLTAQDRQGFRPHVVVQNKVAAPAARELLADLQASFAPWGVRAEGLDWWEYLGGPWKLREQFAFGGESLRG